MVTQEEIAQRSGVTKSGTPFNPVTSKGGRVDFSIRTGGRATRTFKKPLKRKSTRRVTFTDPVSGRIVKANLEKGADFKKRVERLIRNVAIQEIKRRQQRGQKVSQDLLVRFGQAKPKLTQQKVSKTVLLKSAPGVRAVRAKTPRVVQRTSLTPVKGLKRPRKSALTKTQRLEKFEREVRDIKRLEVDVSKRAERSKDIFRAVPGLRGDNFVQKTTRSVLALPILTIAGTAEQAIIAGFKLAATARARVLARKGVLNAETISKEERRALKQAPIEVLKAFNPLTPDGLANIIGGVAFGLLLAKPKAPTISGVRSALRKGASVAAKKAPKVRTSAARVAKNPTIIKKLLVQSRRLHQTKTQLIVKVAFNPKVVTKFRTQVSKILSQAKRTKKFSKSQIRTIQGLTKRFIKNPTAKRLNAVKVQLRKGIAPLKKGITKVKQKVLITKLDTIRFSRKLVNSVKTRLSRAVRLKGLELRTVGLKVGTRLTKAQFRALTNIERLAKRTTKPAQRALGKAIIVFNKNSPVTIQLVKLSQSKGLGQTVLSGRDVRALTKGRLGTVRGFKRLGGKTKLSVIRLAQLVQRGRIKLQQLPKRLQRKVRIAQQKLIRRAIPKKEKGLAARTVRKIRGEQIKARLRASQIKESMKRLAARAKQPRTVFSVNAKTAARGALARSKVLGQVQRSAQNQVKTNPSTSSSGLNTLTKQLSKANKDLGNIGKSKTPAAAKQALGKVAKNVEISSGRLQLILKKPISKPLLSIAAMTIILASQIGQAAASIVSGVGIKPRKTQIGPTRQDQRSVVAQKSKVGLKTRTGTTPKAPQKFKSITIPDTTLKNPTDTQLLGIITSILGSVAGASFLLRSRGVRTALKQTRTRGGLLKLRKLLFSRFRRKRFVFVPDMYSLIFGVRATPGERVRLLRVGRIFSGAEIRKIV